MCKLFLELDPLSKDGSPRDNIDDFLWEPGVVGEMTWATFPGVRWPFSCADLERFGANENVGDVDVAVVAEEGGICID